MAIQYVNTGSGPNSNDGDSIRVAFTKVNTNFTELSDLIGSTGTTIAELVQDATAQLFEHSNHTGFTVIYDDPSDQLIFSVEPGPTGPSGPAGADGVSGIDGPSGPSGPAGNSLAAATTPPVTPATGDLWYDVETGKTFVYYDNSWVDSNPSSYGPMSDTVVDLGTLSGNVTFNRNSGSVQQFTLTGNIVITDLFNMFNGRNLTFIITQDGTGGHGITWPTNFKFAGGANSISTSPNAIDMVNMFQAGSTIFAVVTTGYV